MNEHSQSQPLSLRISVIDRCQLRCVYCMPAEGIQLADRAEIISFEEIVRFVRAANGSLRVGKVRITGGEPLLRRNILRLVEMLAGEGFADLAMTTNGQMLAPMASELKRAGLRRVNVSLDSLNPEVFSRLSRGGDVRLTLAGIDAALECGLLPVKANTVVLRGINDGEIRELVRFGLAHGCEMRFLELMPIGPARQQFDEWFVPSDEVLSQLAASFDIRPIPSASDGTSRNYIVHADDGATGTVGTIASCSVPFCGGCRRLRLTTTGKLLGCLARNDALDLRPMLAAGECDDSRVAAAIADALRVKHGQRQFVRQRVMASIGG